MHIDRSVSPHNIDWTSGETLWLKGDPKKHNNDYGVGGNPYENTSSFNELFSATLSRMGKVTRSFAYQ